MRFSRNYVAQCAFRGIMLLTALFAFRSLNKRSSPEIRSSATYWNIAIGLADLFSHAAMRCRDNTFTVIFSEGVGVVHLALTSWRWLYPYRQSHYNLNRAQTAISLIVVSLRHVATKICVKIDQVRAQASVLSLKIIFKNDYHICQGRLNQLKLLSLRGEATDAHTRDKLYLCVFSSIRMRKLKDCCKLVELVVDVSVFHIRYL